MNCIIHKKRKLQRNCDGEVFCPKCKLKTNKPKKEYFYDDEPLIATRQKGSKIGKGWDGPNSY